MPKKLIKAAKDFNVGTANIVEFLSKKGFEIDNNPNARISDEAYDLLRNEYSKDRDDKEKSDMIFAYQKDKKAKKDQPAKVEEIKTETVQPAGPKIVGTVDLEAIKTNGTAVVTPKPEAVKAEKPAEEKLKEESVKKPEEKPAETPKKEMMPEEKPAEEKPTVEKPAEPVKAEEPKPEKKEETEKPTKKEEPIAENPAKKEERVAEKPSEEKPKAEKSSEEHPQKATEERSEAPVEEAAEKPAETTVEKQEEPESFRLERKDTPQLKIVGTIDLSALNVATRPKRKSKEERKKERNEKLRQQNAAQSNADRRKRQRIAKEKVDIEKAATQIPASEQQNKNKGGGGNNNADRRKDQNKKNNNQRQDSGKKGNRRNVEKDDEMMKNQVKDALERLTNRPNKKSVKWRKEKREEMHNREMERAEREKAESTILKITEFVTANDLAGLMEVPVTQVIATCMNLGVMVSINQRLDAETINIVAEEFGFTTEFVSAEVSEAIETEADSEEDLETRPPIVTVMGHVDHGKTSLLDYIRKANVIAGEAGGITQHIGAYNVELSDGRHITFLDTPGHEAFTAMRARGAKVTDLAIIIVAADDDVMPQTVEAINHASAAGVPIVFAVNKIDKPAANPDKIKEELANMNYLVEEWGGKYQSQDISAKKGIGVDELMEKVLLEAELLDLKANPNRRAVGSVIESSLDKGRGYVATVLVQNGTLRVGDVVLAGTNFGKVKAMFNERNQRVQEATPATPVLILGLNGAPTAGDAFNVIETEQEAREIANKREQLQRELNLRTKKRPGLEDLGRRMALKEFHELNLVVKGDVDGSIEALSDSLIKLSTPEVQVNVLHKGVGAISESDVTLAAASDAIIIGFQVRPSAAARKEAEKEGVEIRLYSVIYKAIEEVKDAMEGMLSPELKEEVTGTAEILQTYHISKVGTIAGAVVREGKIKRSNKVRVIRDGIVIHTGDLGSLKRFKDDVKEVTQGYECGFSVVSYNGLQVGDIIEGFEETEVKKQL